VKFGQPVHGFRKPYRIDVIGLVPSAVECGIAQSVVRGEVNDLAPLPAQDGHGALGFHVGEGEEHDVSLVRQTRRVELTHGQTGEGPQMREHAIEALAREPLRGDRRELDLGMNGEEAKELRPHVAARPRNRHAQHGAYRLEYWNLERAPGWPYFLRSLMRGSRVRSPARLRVGRRLTSNSRRARAMP